MTHKAAVCVGLDQPLEILDIGIDKPHAEEVRVRMLASPINPSDLLYVSGQYGQQARLPATPGFEGVGVVEAAGPTVLRGERIVLWLLEDEPSISGARRRARAKCAGAAGGDRSGGGADQHRHPRSDRHSRGSRAARGRSGAGDG